MWQSVVLAFVLAAAPPAHHDWTAAWKHARAGKAVRLTLVDARTTDRSKRVDVLLVDGCFGLKVGSYSHFARDRGSFAFDLGPVLREKLFDKNPPWNRARIVLRSGARVRYRTFKIELVD